MAAERERYRRTGPAPTPEEFVALFESLGKNAQGYPEFRHRRTGITFVRLPGGTFEMGSRQGEPGEAEAERPRHQVTLGPFLLAKHEVSQESWEAVMKDSPSSAQGSPFPVVSVSWEECVQFCEKAALYLPTEAQWEYACRAGTEGLYAGALNELGWYRENSGSHPHPVGQKKPNGFGLHDMHGNVWEWVRDGGSYKAPCRPVDGARDLPPYQCVFRGGSFNGPPHHCRSAARRFYGRDDRTPSIGFRPAFYPLR